MLSAQEAQEATKLLSGVLLNKLKFTGENLHDEKIGEEYRRLVELDYKVVEKYSEILVGFKAHTEALLKAEQAVNDTRLAMRAFVEKSSGELHGLQAECDSIRKQITSPTKIEFSDTSKPGMKGVVTHKSGVPPPKAFAAVFDQKALSDFVRSMMAAHKLEPAQEGEATIEELCRRILDNGLKNDPLTLATEAREKERVREALAAKNDPNQNMSVKRFPSFKHDILRPQKDK
ncbi:unnamed protein product, partial [Mesorhabditis spiculigera]